MLVAELRNLFDFAQRLRDDRDNRVADIRTVTLVVAINHFVVLVETHDLNRG